MLGVTRLDTAGTFIVNGMPQQRLHVSGLVQVDGKPAEAAAVDVRLGIDQTPLSGEVLPVEVLGTDPLKIRVQWTQPRVQQQVEAAERDAQAQVVADLAAGARPQHLAGEADPLGVALSAPDAVGTIVDQLAATLGTPISLDIDRGGVKQHATANRSSHLSNAEAAQLLRTGTPATATISAATRVPVQQMMLPGPDASLWDLELEVHRADSTSYAATTRVGFRSEARRQVLGLPGLTVPVRTDPDDDSRVAVDGTTYDAQHPDAPPG